MRPSLRLCSCRISLTGIAALAAALAGCGAPAGGGVAQGGTTAAAEADTVAVAPSEPGRSAEEILASLGPASIDPSDPARIRELAGASAPRVMFLSVLPLMAAPGGADADEESCPSVVREGERRTLRGGCTDDEGTRWTGTAVVRGMTEQERAGEVTYRGFGFEKTVQCEGTPRESRWQANGELRSAPERGGLRFEIDLAFEGEGVGDDCRPLMGTGAVVYEGRQVGVGNAVRWSGSGRYGWAGYGVVEASTEDELINQVNCRDEALMGKTTVRSGVHTVEFLYDGERDCDEDSTASWTFDGERQGEMAGVGCAVAGAPVAAGGWILAVVAALTLRARRRSR